MRAVVFGYHDVGCAGLRVLARLGVDVARVYTHADDPVEDTWFGSVRATCEELGIPVDVGGNPNDPCEVSRLRDLAPDALFSFYYRDLLGDDVLRTGKRGAVNLHGSLLPRYRGRAPVNWMILHGEREGGVTLHDMVARPDAGGIVDQEAFPIGPDDRPADVFARVVAAAETVLERSALRVLDGTAPRYLQLESKATTHGRRRPDDGRIDFHHAAEDVRNLVRAVTRPYPGAFAFAGWRRVSVWWTEHAGASAHPSDAPGTLRHVDGALLVRCGDGRCLRLVHLDVESAAPDTETIHRVLADGTPLTSHPKGKSPWMS